MSYVVYDIIVHIVYDVVCIYYIVCDMQYDITYDAVTLLYMMSLSFSISYTMYTIEFIPVPLPQRPSDCSSRIQLPCAWSRPWTLKR